MCTLLLEICTCTFCQVWNHAAHQQKFNKKNVLLTEKYIKKRTWYWKIHWKAHLWDFFKPNLHTNFGMLILHNKTAHYFQGKLTGYPYRRWAQVLSIPNRAWDRWPVSQMSWGIRHSSSCDRGVSCPHPRTWSRRGRGVPRALDQACRSWRVTAGQSEKYVKLSSEILYIMTSVHR